MSQYFVATPEELRLLTKQERNVYEMFRLEGKKREDIAELLEVSLATVTSHWSRAVNKIERHRLLMQNPLAFINEKKQGGVDIFRAEPGQLQKAEETKPDFIPIIGVDETPTLISQSEKVDPAPRDDTGTGAIDESADRVRDVGSVDGADAAGGEGQISGDPDPYDVGDGSSNSQAHQPSIEA